MIRMDMPAQAAISAQLRAMDDRVDAALRRVAAQGMARALRAARTYPPELPNQQYVRTGVLRGGWVADATRIVTTRGGFVATNTNRVAYAGYVQDAAQQARIHQGRWRTTEELARAIEPDVQRDLDGAVAALAGEIER